MAGACSWQRCCLDGVRLCLRPESQVPHLRWSQALPLPWQRPGSADTIMDTSQQIVLDYFLSSEKGEILWQVYFSVLQRHAARYETGGRQLNGDLSMGQNPGTLVFTLK